MLLKTLLGRSPSVNVYLCPWVLCRKAIETDTAKKLYIGVYRESEWFHHVDTLDAFLRQVLQQ